MNLVSWIGVGLAVVWFVTGAIFLAWSTVSPERNYGEAVRRHDLAVKLFLPWLMLGYAGLAVIAMCGGIGA